MRQPERHAAALHERHFQPGAFRSPGVDKCKRPGRLAIRMGAAALAAEKRVKELIMNTLRQVSVGKTVKVKRLHGEGPVKRRIMDMGITKGVEIYVRKVAPLGDPVEVTVRGYELSLRKADAEMIEVE